MNMDTSNTNQLPADNPGHHAAQLPQSKMQDQTNAHSTKMETIKALLVLAGEANAKRPE